MLQWPGSQQELLRVLGNLLGGTLQHPHRVETQVEEGIGQDLAAAGHIGAPAHAEESHRQFGIYRRDAMHVVPAVVNAVGLQALSHGAFHGQQHLAIGVR